MAAIIRRFLAPRTVTGCTSGGERVQVRSMSVPWRLYLLPALLLVTAAAPVRAQDHTYSSADVATGVRLYGAQCQLCHGAGGDGFARLLRMRLGGLLAAGEGQDGQGRNEEGLDHRQLRECRQSA